MIKIEVNGRQIEAREGEMLLDAMEREGIRVPTLCHMKDLFPTGACRMCVVEVEGQRGLVPSCAFPVYEGMKVKTHSARPVKARKTIIELLLASHPDDCLYCVRNGNCDLQSLAKEHGVRERRYEGDRKRQHEDISSLSIVRDPEKCILCGKCVRVCEEVQGVSSIDFVGRGSNATVGTCFNQGLNTSNCINCGQCILVCPTGALRENSHLKRVMEALADPEMHVVAQHAPSISVSIGEEFDLKAGTDCDGVMTAALRRLGFDRVFDTSFSADLTIMEEGSELVDRVKNGGALPMMTSCSPGWVKFIEHNYPSLLPNVSSCKSPQQMMGAIIKSFYAEKQSIDPKKIFSVSIMPCVAKKFEAARPEMGNEGTPDVDAVLTTREFARLIKMRGLDLKDIQPENADSPFGERTGAGKIFGASGGVMEAALRSAYFLLTGEELENLDVKAVRGMDGIKEAHVEINGMNVGVAVVNGIGNARKLLDQIVEGRDDIHFIEVMTCPGGCINGGGQPIGVDPENARKRMASLYQIDADAPKRTSHSNEEIQRLYDEFLGKPLGEKSHHLLHTHYEARKNIG